MEPAAGCAGEEEGCAGEVLDRLLASGWLDQSEWARGKCPGCNKSCRFFCPTCRQLVNVPRPAARPSPAPGAHPAHRAVRASDAAAGAPQAVPAWSGGQISVDLVLHDQHSKCSGLQIPTLARPVACWQYPDQMPDTQPDWDPATAGLVYPCPEARSLLELAPAELATLRRLVLVDCRWQSGPCSPLFQETCLRQIPLRIKLAAPPDKSRFWRYHHKGAGCLSTAEACYYVLLDYVRACAKHGLPLGELADESRYDQLLAIFALQYQSVASCYQAGGAHHEHTSGTGRITGPPPFAEEGKAYQRQKRAQLRGQAGREFHQQNASRKAKRIEAMQAENRRTGKKPTLGSDGAPAE